MYDINLIPEKLRQHIVVNNDGCWIWQRAKTKRGYGNFNVYNEDGSYKNLYVHRVVYEIYKGKIPNGLFVCHTCDVPSCCNPEHLWTGTNKDNILDFHAKKPGFYGKRIVISPENLKQLKEDYQSGIIKLTDASKKYNLKESSINTLLRGSKGRWHRGKWDKDFALEVLKYYEDNDDKSYASIARNFNLKVKQLDSLITLGRKARAWQRKKLLS